MRLRNRNRYVASFIGLVPARLASVGPRCVLADGTAVVQQFGEGTGGAPSQAPPTAPIPPALSRRRGARTRIRRYDAGYFEPPQ